MGCDCTPSPIALPPLPLSFIFGAATNHVLTGPLPGAGIERVVIRTRVEAPMPRSSGSGEAEFYVQQSDDLVTWTTPVAVGSSFDPYDRVDLYTVTTGAVSVNKQFVRFGLTLESLVSGSLPRAAVFWSTIEFKSF